MKDSQPPNEILKDKRLSQRTTPNSYSEFIHPPSRINNFLPKYDLFRRDNTVPVEEAHLDFYVSLRVTEQHNKVSFLFQCQE